MNTTRNTALERLEVYKTMGRIFLILKEPKLRHQWSAYMDSVQQHGNKCACTYIMISESASDFIMLIQIFCDDIISAIYYKKLIQVTKRIDFSSK